MKENLIKSSSVLIFLYLCCLQACTSTDDEYTNNKYFQYYISTIRIQNPRVVLFDNKGGSLNPMHNWVCPDSAVKYCAEPDWIYRNDVFLQNNSSYYTENVEGFHAFGNWFYKFKPWDRGYSLSYDVKPFNDTIYVGRYYFDEDLLFTLSLYTTGFYYDNTQRPKNEPLSEKWDVLDTLIFDNTYRLAVCPKYSILQAYKLRKLQKESRICYEIAELMRINPNITIPEIAEEMHTSEKKVEKYISNLQTKGIIRQVHGGKGRQWEVIE